MLLNAESVNGIGVIALPERINSANSASFQQEMAPLMVEYPKIVFDLVNVRSLDSSGLGSLVACAKHLRTSGGDVKLCGMSKQIRTLFELVRMHHVFDIFDSKLDALDSYK